MFQENLLEETGNSPKLLSPKLLSLTQDTDTVPPILKFMYWERALGSSLDLKIYLYSRIS